MAKNKKWYEVCYQKAVYGPLHKTYTEHNTLESAYKEADELRDLLPKTALVWIDECTLEKKEVKRWND